MERGSKSTEPTAGASLSAPLLVSLGSARVRPAASTSPSFVAVSPTVHRLHHASVSLAQPSPAAVSRTMPSRRDAIASPNGCTSGTTFALTMTWPHSASGDGSASAPARSGSRSASPKTMWR